MLIQAAFEVIGDTGVEVTRTIRKYVNAIRLAHFSRTALKQCNSRSLTPICKWRSWVRDDIERLQIENLPAYRFCVKVEFRSRGLVSELCAGGGGDVAAPEVLINIKMLAQEYLVVKENA